MDPADSRLVSVGKYLTLLWNYYGRIIHTADPYNRQLELVFFDHFLLSTASTVTFLDINGLKRIITALRARLNYELFGMGGPGKEDSAALLETLAAWCSRRQQHFSPRFVAKSLNPLLKKKCYPCHHHPTTLPLTPVVLTGAVAISTPQQEQPQKRSTSFLSGTPASSSTRKQQSHRRRITPKPEFGTSARPAVVSVQDTDSVISDFGTLYSGAECFVTGDSTPSDFPTSPAVKRLTVFSSVSLSATITTGIITTFTAVHSAVSSTVKCSVTVFACPFSGGCAYSTHFGLFF